MFKLGLRSLIYYNYISMYHTKLNLKLTPTQQKVFKILMRYREQLKLKTTLRVAGGWVRDKIIGHECHDIDIALDDMKGQQFVNLIKNYAESQGEKMSGFGVTRFNPQMSKHLQTATITIYDQSIDFVNLRSEKYHQHSRIPTIDIGTPLQDAQRRDFTINSLFYNLNTQQIEDWTQKGIYDLQNGIIRTPLDPLLTFKDDPLRVLRCFRFAGRFNYKIVEQILQALKEKQIIQALRLKVSKQRIGIQLMGMLKSKHPLISLEHILHYGLWNVVFQIPKQSDLKDQSFIAKIPKISFSYVKEFLRSIQQNHWITQKDLTFNEESAQQYQQGKQLEEIQKKKKEKQLVQYPHRELRVLMQLSCLTYVYAPYFKINKKNKEPFIQYLIKNELKYSAKYAKFAQKTAECVHQFFKLKSVKHPNHIIKWLRFCQEKWQITLHIALAVSTVTKQNSLIHPMQLREQIIKNKWDKVYLTEPFIDGHYLTKKGKKGPIIRIILENATIWRILNPQQPREQFLKVFDLNTDFFCSQTAYD